MRAPRSFATGVVLGWLLCGCAPEPPSTAIYFPGCTRLAGYESAIAELEHALLEGLGDAHAAAAEGAWTLECIVENHGERAVTRLRLFSTPDAHPMWSASFGMELPQREAAVAALRSVVERLRTTRAPARS